MDGRRTAHRRPDSRPARAGRRSRRRRSSCRSRAPTSSSGSAGTAATLDAGFHILVPFVDVIRYRHSLKESRRRHPGAGLHHARQRAGRRRRRALSQGAQSGARVVRHLRLHLRHHAARADDAAQRDRQDRSRQARSRSARNINTQVVSELDKASEPWGVKVLRYEIKNITPPHDVLAAMEKQMRAEREKRAVILTSEGAARRGDQHRRRRQAAGHQGVGSAQAAADQRGRRAGRGDPGGRDRDRRRHPPRRRGDPACRAASRRCSCASPSSTSTQFGKLAKESDTLVILPANVADVGSMIALAMKVINRQNP